MLSDGSLKFPGRNAFGRFEQFPAGFPRVGSRVDRMVTCGYCACRLSRHQHVWLFRAIPSRFSLVPAPRLELRVACATRPVAGGS